MDSEYNFLGIGWKFPPSFDEKTGKTEMSFHMTDIKESLYILLNTKPGERLMSPTYGCDIKSFNFKNINSTLVENIKETIEKAISKFETRIKVDSLDVNLEDKLEGKLYVNINYTVLMTNQKDNLVYPFYVEPIRHEI